MAKAKFDIKTEAQRGLHASVGAADLALETLKEYVADAQKRLEGVQKSVADADFEPKVLREQATTALNARVEELSKEAKARRIAVEKRVAELQAEAQKLPTRVQSLLTENVDTATDTYDDLVKRGETVLRKFRNKPATKKTVSSAKTTVAKAKTTKTQATKAAKTVKSSAKATGTAAKKTATNAAKTVS